MNYPYFFWGAKELGIVFINILKGATEPRNLQNHGGVKALGFRGSCLTGGAPEGALQRV